MDAGRRASVDAGIASDAGPVSCLDIADCPADAYCHLGERVCKGLAFPACRSDEQCAPGQTCLVAEGRLIGNCEGAATGCRADSDCGPRHYCAEGSCLLREPNGACATSGDCSASQSCQGGECVTLPGRLGELCDDANPCGAGETCLGITADEDICVSACGSGDDCPSGSFCYRFAGARVCIADRILQGGTQTTLGSGASCDPESLTACRSLLCLEQGGVNRCANNCARDAHCSGSQRCYNHVNEGTAGQNNRLIDVCLDAAQFGTFPGAGVGGTACVGATDCRCGLCSGAAALRRAVRARTVQARRSAVSSTTTSESVS